MTYHSKSGVYGYIPRTEDVLDSLEESVIKQRQELCNICRFVQAYRQHGHKKAVLDPLGLKGGKTVVELSAERYGLRSSDGGKIIDASGIFSGVSGPVSCQEFIAALEKEYCGSLTAEFEHLSSEEEREWFAQMFETKNQLGFTPERKIKVGNILLKALAFDNFLASKFTTLKRYGGEGAEGMMGFFDEVFSKSSEEGVTNVVIGMPHRGRLSFLAVMLNYPVATMFRKIKGLSEFPPGVQGTGDVLSHLYSSVNLDYNGYNLHVSFLPNPSHLDAVSPVAVGKARAKQQTLRTGEYSEDPSSPSDKVVCVQVHGDGSFSGQGVIAETFSFANCPHFSVNGSVHLIVNNQLGYTTEEHYGRSSLYCSDVAKMNACPVLHVNGESPEDVLRATSIAMAYRLRFKKDVIVDLVCYRKSGHNEMDEPSFTQPLMYSAIRSRKSVPDLYADQLVSEGLCSKEDLLKNVSEWNNILGHEFSQIGNPVKPYHLLDQWSDCVQASDQVTTWDTGVDESLLKYIGAKSVEFPPSFNIHPTIQKTHVEKRRQRLEEGTNIDWSTGETLAIGSLLCQGFNVRISGQDVGRGTFSQRHGMLVDQSTDEISVPLNNIIPDQKGFLEMSNSVLSEEAVLGFEYGMSLESPNNLVIWEAQFGDFFNGAQIMIDAFVTSGENKWLLQSGIVMLLPHGYDGAGPEHTSCRMERFLQMTDSKEDGVDGDNVNFQVANPSTPAQYFHLLRQQVVRNYRKPLVVVAPKILLRYPAAVSTLADMAPGTSLSPVLGDPHVSFSQVKRLVFCSGKHYYTLHKEREARERNDIAFVRLESLCPFPAAALQKEIQKYPKASEFMWSQEEQRNMGAWSFISPRFQNIVGVKLKYAGRGVLGLPAVGIGEMHQRENQDILDQTFE